MNPIGSLDHSFCTTQTTRPCIGIVRRYHSLSAVPCLNVFPTQLGMAVCESRIDAQYPTKLPTDVPKKSWRLRARLAARMQVPGYPCRFLCAVRAMAPVPLSRQSCQLKILPGGHVFLKMQSCRSARCCNPTYGGLSFPIWAWRPGHRVPVAVAAVLSGAGYHPSGH